MTGFTHADTAIAQASSSVASEAVTLTGAIGVGDLVCAYWNAPTIGSDVISDSASIGTWVYPAAGNNFSRMAYCIATTAAAGGTIITVTGGGSNVHRSLVADRFTVSGGYATFGGVANVAAGGTSGNLGSLSGVPAGALLWGALHSDTASVTYTAGSSNSVSCTIGSQTSNANGSDFSEYILSAAGGTESMTWTCSPGVTGLNGWQAYFTVSSFTAVGAVIDQAASSFSLTPHAVGDLILITIRNVSNNTVTVTGVSSTNVNWQPISSSFAGTTNADTQIVYAGTVTSTSTATVTISWSGTAPTVRVDGQEFSSITGSWMLMAQGNLDVAGTNTWASLTAKAGDLYFGTAYDTAGAVAGSTPGFTYVVDSHGNGIAYNVNCSAGATAPVWGDSTMAFGTMILVRTGIRYNTGAAAATSNATSQAITIPNTGGLQGTGVLVNDVMLLNVSAFTETSTPPTISISGGGGSWQLVPMTDGSANPQLSQSGAIYSYVWAYQRVATAGDIGATLTVTETGSPSGTTWMGVSMAAYTGANTLNPIDRAGGATENNVTQYVVMPTETARIYGDWAVYMAGGGWNIGAVAVPPAGSTQRQSAINGGGTGTAIADSNGSVGLNSVGGGHYYNNGAGSAAFLSGFTICLAPAGIYMVQTSNVNSGFSSSFGSNVTPGDSIVMVATGHQPGTTIVTSAPLYNGASVTGAAKLLSNQTSSGVGGTGNAAEDVWLLPNVQSAGTSYGITTNSQLGPYVGTFVYEVLGLGPNPVLDKSSSQFGNTTSDQSSGASGATTYGSGFIVGVNVQDVTMGSSYPPAGWTSTGLSGNSALNSVSGYRIATSSGGSYTYDCGVGNADWAAAVVVLAPTQIFMIQSASNTGTGSTITVTLPYPTKAGNCLIVAADGSNSPNPTVTGMTLGGSADNFEHLISAGDVPDTAGLVAIWADPSCAGGQTSVVVTFSAASTNGGCVWVYEVSGLAASGILDQSSAAFTYLATAATWDSGTTPTTAQAAELWFGAIGAYNTTITGPSSPWINSSQITSLSKSLMVGYQIRPMIGTADYSGSFSPNSYQDAAVVALRSTPAAGGGANVNGTVAAVSVAGPDGARNVSTPGSLATVTVAGPTGIPGTAVVGVASNVAVGALDKPPSVSVTAIGQVLVAAPPGRVTGSTKGTLLMSLLP